MNTLSSFVKRNRLVTFFILTFGISWGGTLLGINVFPIGPSIAGIILVWLTYDRAERRDFWRRVIDVKRISAGWYALIILIFPALMVASILLDVLLGGSLPGMDQLKQIASEPLQLLLIAFTTLVIGALSEELGWRGYALDVAPERWGTLRSSLLIGIFWWVWHLPLFASPGTLQYQWGWFTVMFWVYALTVILLSVLMAWVRLHNRASILSAILLHFFFNLTLGMIFPFSDRFFFIHFVLLSLAVALIVRLRPAERRASATDAEVSGPLYEPLVP
jgi:membrane protease YdiL (CAAX protease family)